MGDIIDERNEKERISRSIVKFWNVNYIPTPWEGKKTMEGETETGTSEKATCETTEKPLEREEFYNAATGSYSGTYGAEEVSDEATKGRINQILREKDEALRNLIDENAEDYYWEEK